MDTPVLVVGAGPTGLMLALQLARHGVAPLIVDRHAGPAEQSRAMVVHARTLEYYRPMGLADEAVALGTVGTGANMWTNGRWSARIPVGDIGTGLSAYPFVLMLGQDENERLLGRALAAAGLAVSWNTELVALRQEADGVSATLRLPDGGERVVRAAWVAGCDGARSAVRQMNGIGFPGAPYEHTFYVADTVATGPMKPGEVNVFLARDGFQLFFPMRGENRWRAIGILPGPLRARDGVVFDDVVPALRADVGESLRFADSLWFSTYRIHHRSAERFRDRRCLLLGDAAHIHSPMGGQGMNTGLQDAGNLGWKLALVCRGRADPALLDSYAAERMPVARRLLETTDRAFQLVVSARFLSRFLRTRLIGRIAALAMRFAAVRRRAFMTLSQIGIAYRDSALSVAAAPMPKGAPAPGERFPWLTLRFEANRPAEDLFQRRDDRRFTLLVFGQAAPAPGALPPAAGLLDVLAVPDRADNAAALARASVPLPSFYLLRPDGHVGLCGRAFDAAAIGRYFAERVRLA